LLGLTWEETAAATAEAEHCTERTFFNTLTMQFALKRANSDQKAGYVLTIARKERQGLRVEFAIRVPRNLVGSPEDPRPLQVLHRYLGLVGLEVTVGDKVGHLILDEAVQLSETQETQDLMQIVDRARHSIVSLSLVALKRQGATPIAQCAVALAVDVDRYHRVIRGHDPDSEVTVDLAPSVEAALTASQLFAPTATFALKRNVKDIIAEVRERRSGYLARVSAPGYSLELGFREGGGYIRRNTAELHYPVSSDEFAGERASWVFTWSPTMLQIHLAASKARTSMGETPPTTERAAATVGTRSLETPQFVLPEPLVQFLRRRSVLPRTQYTSLIDLWRTVRESLDDISLLIEATGKPNPFWDVTYEGGAIVSRRPKREPECHAAIQLLFDRAALAKNLTVIPEFQTAGGALDFLITGVLASGAQGRICVEFKHAHSRDLYRGLMEQLPRYMESQAATYGIYGVFWFKGRDWDQPTLDLPLSGIADEPEALRSALGEAARVLPGRVAVVVIDVSRRLSPSRG
jgi:hypothetical protein